MSKCEMGGRIVVVGLRKADAVGKSRNELSNISISPRCAQARLRTRGIRVNPWHGFFSEIRASEMNHAMG